MPPIPPTTSSSSEAAAGRKFGTIDGAVAQKARDYLIVGLKNIHAVVRQGRITAQTQIERLENFPELQEKLKSHLNEKNLQLQRTEKILTDLGETSSGIKDAAMGAMGLAEPMVDALADDGILKDCLSSYGLANFEAAAYETLLFFAEEAGEMEAVGPLQESLDEERRMASFILDNLPDIARSFLEQEAEGVKMSH